MFLSCTGNVLSGSVAPVSVVPTSFPKTECRPLEAPLRTLTARQYDNVIRVLLKDETDFGKKVPVPTSETRFDNHHEWISPNETLIRFYSASAEKLAASAVQRQGALFGCVDPPQAMEKICLESIFNTFARKAFRHSLNADEKTSLRNVFTAVRSIPQSTYREALAATLEVILQSPQFLYFTEVGVPLTDQPRAKNALTPLELASKLALFLWGSIPDEALLDAAESNRLSSREDVAREAQRMLKDSQASQGFYNFSVQWLDIEKLASASKNQQVFPLWTPEISASAMAETRWLLDEALQSGTFASLLESRKSALQGALGPLYGLPAPATLTQLNLPSSERSGVMTRVAFLASHAHSDQSSPTLRGKAVRTRFLCEDIPPPPPNVNVTLPNITTNATLRNRLDAHLNASSSCAGCHRLLDPIGFGFENYDGTGKFRVTEANGLSIDARGEIITGAGTQAFQGPLELSSYLARSPLGRSCFTTQLYRYALGRSETSKDRCHLNGLASRISEGTSIQETLVQLVTSDAFMTREPVIP
jgi:Protein of unknown function (DUF1592)/Protein of unknown function (DUF1588)/Protein of unknown function (DUF1595)/Protein of unknown function (DUF1585)/Protein of unknown function (DUF1587)